MYDSDSEDILPPGWQTEMDSTNRVIFRNYLTDEIQTRHPVDRGERFLPSSLPEGWLKSANQSGSDVFIHSRHGYTSFVNPCLALPMKRRYPHCPKYSVKFDGLSTAFEVLDDCDVVSKYFIILGGSRGVGLTVVKALAARGGIVIYLSRSPSSELSGEHYSPISASVHPIAGQVFWSYVDLTRFSSLKQFSEMYRSLGWPVHGLILAAATLSSSGSYGVGLSGVVSFIKRILGWPARKQDAAEEAFGLFRTEDGFDVAMQTNFLGHILLLRLLLPCLRETAKSRVLFVSCEAHRATDVSEDTSDLHRCLLPASLQSATLSGRVITYANSKLFQLLYASALRHRLFHSHSNVNRVGVFVCSPGNLLCTALVPFNYDWWWLRALRWLAWPFIKSLESAAATVIYCIAHEDVSTAVIKEKLDDTAWLYFNNCAPCHPHELLTNRAVVNSLWEQVNSCLENVFALDAL